MATDAVVALQEAARKAREFSVTRGECQFTLRTPTRHEVHQVTHELGLRDLSQAAQFSLLEYELVRRFLVAWQGVRVRDVVPPVDGQPGDLAPVPHAPATVGLYLDANPTHADAMALQLMARIRVRNQQLEDDAKNSQRTLPQPEMPTRCEPQPSSSA